MTTIDKLTVTAQDAYNYAVSKLFSDQQLCMVVKLSGRLGENVLEKAVRLSMDLEPVLGCRFVENGSNPFWERRKDLDQIKTCHVLETMSPQKELEAFLNEPIHADVDLLVSTKIFREKNTDIVCIKMNHSASDAGGLKEYGFLLSDIYTMLNTCGKSSIQPNMGRRDQTQIFQHTKDLRTIIMKEFPTPTWTFPQRKAQSRFILSKLFLKSSFLQ